MKPAPRSIRPGNEGLYLDIRSSTPRINPEFMMTEMRVQDLRMKFMFEFICNGEPGGNPTQQYAKEKAFSRGMKKE